MAELYIRFDLFTLLPLIAFIVIEEAFGTQPYYLSQWVVLLILFIIGYIDFKWLWPFYSGAADWHQTLTRKAR